MRGLAFGASYDRRLFGDYGYFREDLRIAEDTDFNGRLPEEKKPVWQPNVRTIHRNPTNPVTLLADHFARGTRAAWSSVEFAAPTMPFGLAGWWRRTSVAFRMSRYTHERDRLYVRMALPIIPLATAAYCLGAQYWILSAGRRHREAPAPVAGMPESDTAGAEQRPVTPTAGADLGIGLPLAATGLPETPNDHPPSFL